MAAQNGPSSLRDGPLCATFDFTCTGCDLCPPAFFLHGRKNGELARFTHTHLESLSKAFVGRIGNGVLAAIGRFALRQLRLFPRGSVLEQIKLLLGDATGPRSLLKL